MLITIVNGWHDDNKGDSAITIATAQLLEKHLNGARLALVSELPLKEREYAASYRHVLSETSLREKKIASRLLPSWNGRKDPMGYLSLAAYLVKLGWSAGKLAVRGAPYSDAVGVDLIREAQLVVSKGGHLFHIAKRYNLVHLANLYAHAYPLLLAHRYAVPYVLLGQSIGPLADPLGRAIVRTLLRHALVVFVRESISFEYALGLGVPERRLRVIPDLAFSITPRLNERVIEVMAKHQLIRGEFVAVTVRFLPHASKKDYERYLSEIGEAIRSLLRRGLCGRVAVVVHTLGPTYHENDLYPSLELMRRIKGLPVELVNEDLLPSELAALYGEARLTVGTRFHSVILSLVGGTPAYAVSYFGPKSMGIMRDIGMEENCCSASEFRAEMLVRLAPGIIEKRTEIGDLVLKQRAHLNEAMDDLKSYVEG